MLGHSAKYNGLLGQPRSCLDTSPPRILPRARAMRSDTLREAGHDDLKVYSELHRCAGVFRSGGVRTVDCDIPKPRRSIRPRLRPASDSSWSGGDAGATGPRPLLVEALDESTRKGGLVGRDVTALPRPAPPFAGLSQSLSLAAVINCPKRTTKYSSI
ncbi:hypothetical protein EVAR_82538_1 [Eumeta japonica]|uniref:Uncharacterized protein n=1 Tax=Eumeta variegata TaxID=151549 RepID=A0A4C1UXQ6_EUMVA|nr:hypothetical protein EVAR_82538_1 [Eumeta japonica]